MGKEGGDRGDVVAMRERNLIRSCPRESELEVHGLWLGCKRRDGPVSNKDELWGVAVGVGSWVQGRK